MKLVDPVVFVPGITATYLQDEYPLPPENVWTVLTKRYERAAMHPDDLRYEAIQPARVRPGQIFGVAYEELVDELRYNLSPAADRPVPVYAFNYDWRHPLDVVESLLADFVNEVIERTKLLPHYYKDGYQDDPRVNLVAHSMGGLVVTGYLDTHGKKAPVAKVATLATPYQGAYEAPIKVITGTANLGTKAPSSREREAARLTPALYHLLPSFSRALKSPPGVPNSFFDAGVWQASVVDSIAEFVRLHGLPKKDRTTKKARRDDAARLFAAMLGLARRHRSRIDKFDLGKTRLKRKDWLAVVGVNSVTRVRMEVIEQASAPQFALSSDDRRDDWRDPDPQKARLTGDGTVPLEGALPKFLDETDIVCVSPDDFGYWEIEDRALVHLAGFHGILPNMNMLHRMLVRFFTGGTDRRGNTWGRSLPGVSKSGWKPPLTLAYRARETD